MKIVPDEPTQEMLPQAWRTVRHCRGQGVDHECLRDIWRAMLVAAPSPWQPIETAPKDGTRIVIAAQGEDGWEQKVGWFSGYGSTWVTAILDGHRKVVFYAPTHWHPLADPPDA